MHFEQFIGICYMYNITTLLQELGCETFLLDSMGNIKESSAGQPEMEYCGPAEQP